MKHLSAVLAAAILLAGCGEEKPRPTPLFHAGQYVKVKLDGRRGMVTSVWCSTYYPTCYYYIRFGIPSSATDTSLLGADGDIKNAPYSKVEMREFELEAAI